MKTALQLIVRKNMLLALLVLGSSYISFSQVDLAATGGTPAATYATLKEAFDAINSGTHTGSIAIGISANTTETAPAVLNSSGAGAASYTNIAISPSADGVSISGSTTTGRGLIELKGADNVTINGDNPGTVGTNRNLSIINTASSTTTLTSVIRVATAATNVTSADNISISNCNLVGSATGRNLSTATSTTSSENNTFVIYAGGGGGASATDSPAALTSVTTNSAPAGTTINNFVVTNCSILSAARGIVFIGAAAANSTSVTVTNNSVGEQSTALSGFAPFASPVNTVYTKGIYISGTGSVTITGNTVKNILSYVGTTMAGIELNSAIGTAGGTVTVSNNVVESVSNNGSSNANGIFINNSSVAYTAINNQVSNIQTVGAGSASGFNVTTAAPSGFIGSNNIRKIFANSLGGYAARGIYVLGGSNVTIQNNMITDLNAANNNTNTTTTFGVKGIVITAGTGHRIYHNSVNLFGAMFGSGTSSDNTTCLTLSATSITGVQVYNNIFSNKMSGAAATVHGCIQIPSGLTSAMNLSINNNAYYTGSNANNYVGITSGTFNSYSTLPAFLAYTTTLSAAGTNDNASYSSQNTPPFISNDDLHLELVSPELGNVEQKGITGLLGAATDIDGNTRPDGATTIPDMGADEVSAPAACSGTPTPGSISGNASICEGGSSVLTLNGLPVESGLSFQWSSSAVSGGPYSNALGSALTQNTGALTATTYYVVTVTCANGGLSASTNEFTLTVNPNPVVAVTPSSTTYCNPGPAVSLTASGALNYAWTPATGLSSNIGATVAASPNSNTTYSVTGIDGNGCTFTTTVPVTVTSSPIISSVTATPSAVCSGSDSQLAATATISYNQTVAAYSFAGSTGTYTPITGTASTAAGDDGTQGSIPIGFNFNYNGASFSTFAINTNGGIQLGSATFTTFTNNLTTNANTIMPLWDDNNATGATIQYATTGTSPNQVLTIQWAGLHIGGSGSSTNPTIDMQVVLYEATGVIEFIYGNTSAALLSTSASIGISGAAGNYLSVTPLSPANTSTASSTAENNSISSEANFPSGTIYTFTPPVAPVLSYVWSPATNLSSTTVANPTASNVVAPETYGVTVSATNGCSVSSTVSLTVNPLPSAPTTANSNQCGAQVPTASVASTSGLTSPVFVWYDAATGGTALQTSASSTYTSPVSATTTFYVAEQDALTGCVSSTTPVTVSVSAADNILAAVNNNTICIGASIDLSVANSSATPVQNYAYTWTNADAGSGLVTQNGATVTVTPSIPGTYTYEVSGVDGSCNALSSVVVTVDPYSAVLSAVNISCNGANDGSFSLVSEACGTAGSYSVDGGVFGPIPTNLTPGNHTVIVKNADGFETAAIVINLTEPAAIPVALGLNNTSICQGDASGTLTLPTTTSLSLTATFDLAAQPAVIGTTAIPATIAATPNLIATATLPALPAGAVVTGATFTMNGLTPFGGSWASDVYFGFNGAYSSDYLNGTAAPNSVTAFNYTRPFTGTYNPAGGTVELHYYDRYDDNIGDECTFPTGTAVGTLTITYTYLNATDANWYDAATGGTLQGSGTPFDFVGTPLLPNTNTPGTYTFYAEGTDGNCVSATRTPVTVTINATSSSTTAATECDTYTWTNGTTYTASGTYTQTLVNALGCDSVATLNLTIINGSTSTTTVTECGSYTWTDGNTYTSSGSYTQVLQNAAGCDSTATLVLTINAIPVATATDNGDASITASAGSSYEWIDCATNITITGATAQTFTATANGSYQVVVFSAGNCSDTSDCVVIDYIGINEIASNVVSIYPNPTSDNVTISMKEASALVEILDGNGKLIRSTVIENGKEVDLSGLGMGVYVFRITTETNTTIHRVVKN